MIGKFLAGVALAALAGMANAQTVSVNFDDGTLGSAVGSFYSGDGVTFSANTRWVQSFSLPGTSGALAIATDNVQPFIFGPDTPIVATFAAAVNHVKITGADVGAAGLEIDAYDASNTLVGSNSAFGVGANGSFFDVFVDIAGITSVHIFQPGSLADHNALTDGLVLDNFEFTVAGTSGVPEPATWALMIGGFGLAGAALRRRRSVVAS